MKKIELILVLLGIFGLSCGEVQPGLRGIFIYTHDSSFVGFDLQVQKLAPEIYEKFIASKQFLDSPKPLASSYEFLGLLDGRCDIQLKCAKQECQKVVQPTCPPKEKCPVCKACPICPEVKECPAEKTTVAVKTTTKPPVTLRTLSVETKPPTTTRTFVTRPPSTYLPPSCDNGAKNYPDCCLNGGSGQFCCINGAENRDCCENGGRGKFCCTNGAQNEFCCLNGASNKDCQLKSIITTPKPPTPSTKKTFRGPPYLPQSTFAPTTRQPFTGTYGKPTYVTRTFHGTFPASRTWQPFTANTFSYKEISRRSTQSYSTTTTPKYERIEVQNGLKYNNL